MLLVSNWSFNAHRLGHFIANGEIVVNTALGSLGEPRCTE